MNEDESPPSSDPPTSCDDEITPPSVDTYFRMGRCDRLIFEDQDGLEEDDYSEESAA